jgi:capsid protein
LDKGMFTTLPWGYQLKQMKAEQPTTVYDKFVDALLREIARPLLMPFNMAVGFSGGYNFASGTLGSAAVPQRDQGGTLQL